jgi:lipoyl synthase
MRARKPEWLKVRAPGGPNYLRLQKLMREQRLHTVCEEAHCPNIGECWESGTATFMILGDVCTRACKYCAVAHGLPDRAGPGRAPPRRRQRGDDGARARGDHLGEPRRAEGRRRRIYAETIRQIHERVPGCSVEVLIPDFKGNEDALRTVVEAKPEILAHNVDTVERLMRALRPGGRYWRSISVLGAVKRMDPACSPRARSSWGWARRRRRSTGRCATCARPRSTSSRWASTCAPRRTTSRSTAG